MHVPFETSELPISIVDAAKKLWLFHQVYSALRPADAIIGLGSYDLRVADRCAELYHSGFARIIVFTGFRGNWTSGNKTTEASAFAARAYHLGVPIDAILLEERATNIGENIAFTAKIIPSATSIIFVTKPQTQKRCLTTVKKQWPEIVPLVTAPMTSFYEQPTSGLSLRDVICELVGDLRRLQIYSKTGFQAAIEIPNCVLRANDVLVEAGFVDHLP
jgi:uncharacterized SAM-binding protein YcdF (DUF218 family)